MSNHGSFDALFGHFIHADLFLCMQILVDLSLYGLLSDVFLMKRYVNKPDLLCVCLYVCVFSCLRNERSCPWTTMGHGTSLRVYCHCHHCHTSVISVCGDSAQSVSTHTYTIHYTYTLRKTIKLEGQLTPNCASILGGDQDRRRNQTLCSPPCLPGIQFLQWERPEKTGKPAHSLLSKSTSDRYFTVALHLSLFSGFFWLKWDEIPQSHHLRF